MKIIFKNATVISAAGRKVRDVFVDGESISDKFDEASADRLIDSGGKYLMPGVIDSHVHFREPGHEYKEDFVSGSRAAAIGGVTTVLDMPNNNPPITTVATFEEKMEIAKKKSIVNVSLFMGATSDNFEELRKVEGAVGFKIYMGSSTGNLLNDDENSWEKIFRIAKAKNLPVVVHAENEQMIHNGKRDCECALKAVEAAISIHKKVGNKLHIAHLSCAAELELFKKHKNTNLSCEVSPHHLFFNDDDVVDGRLKVNPPIRSAENVLALWHGVRDGTVTCLATDHAPHTLEEKLSENPPAGVPGVEFLLPLMLNEVNLNTFSFERLVDLICESPARIFDLKNKGKIEIGMDADLVLTDMEMKKKITRESVKSKCGWSPYEDYTLKGWPVMTVVGGKVIEYLS